MTRLVINGRFLTRSVSGVERFATETVRALDRIVDAMPPEDRPRIEIIAPKGGRTIEGLAHIQTHFRGGFGGHLWEQTLLPLLASGATLLNPCNTSPFLKWNQVNCIHDANVWLMPENYSFAFRTLYKLSIPRGMAFNRAWVTISEFSKSQLMHRALPGTRPGVVVWCGYEHVLGWKDTRSELSEAVLAKPFVLLVGSRAKNKNIRTVLAQAPALAKAGIQIYVTGARNASIFADTDADPEDENITWLGAVSDGDLRRLYSRALCLAFPSFFEGFGLPVLEAMALGCPVVSSTTSCLPEIGGDAVVYADPSRGDEWRHAILRIATDETHRRALTAAGLHRAEMFTWSNVAADILALCRLGAAERRAADTVSSTVISQ